MSSEPYIKEKIGFVNACSLFFGITLGCMMAPILKTYYLTWFNIKFEKILSSIIKFVFILLLSKICNSEVIFYFVNKYVIQIL